ncbi:DUF3017 domain-containing protein [Streptomyces sp. GC420]|nr:DUF3017 domain-containing protein [Streptomyces sp. GC420]NBM19567.1 DUF3017 domain-containing protein [Streptomyces sp. GC420]
MAAGTRAPGPAAGSDAADAATDAAEGDGGDDDSRRGDGGKGPAEAVDQDAVVARGAVSAPGPDGEPVRATRRFPLFTRDTARPEGGGRAAPSDAPAPARQWPLLTVLGGAGVGLLVVAAGVFRIGTLLIGAALLGGAVLRWLRPSVGMLAVRSRFTDIVTYGVMGTLIMLLALVAHPNPWLDVPILEDAVQFTVH